MPDHPYQSLESHPAWQAIDAAISDLEDNGDLREQTARVYIVGYLVKALVKGGLLKEPAE